MKLIDDLQEQISGYYDNIVILLPKLALAILVCLIVNFLLKVVKNKTVSYLSTRADDKLLANFAGSLINITKAIILVLIFLYIIGQGAVATSILGAAGLSAFVIGFALKDIGENFLAGVIMAFDRPFRLGDVVKTGNVEGVITEMSLRDTHIKTFDGKDVYVPNGQFIKNPLYNYTIDGFLRQSFIIGVDYGSDIQQVRTIMEREINSLPGVLKDEKPARTHVKNLNTSSIDVEVQYWINTFDKEHSSTETKSQAQSNIVTALTKVGINIPSSIVMLKNYDSQVTA